MGKIEVFRGPAAPFLKWAGGKGQLLAQFEKYFPQRWLTYFEPFVGGGAVFFHLMSRNRIRKAVISDSNKDLINCYVAVRDRREELLGRLQVLQRHAMDKAFFYEQARLEFNSIRLKNGLEGNVEKAALFIYLNKTCYNGIYRVNKKGEFNVPWGRYTGPRIYDEGNIRAVHGALTSPNVRVLCADYSDVLRDAGPDDFVYFDPPYHPISRTSNFTEYTAKSFGTQDQRKLAALFHELSAKGSHLMLSNSPKVKDLYKEFRVKKVRATRAISCIGSKRGRVDEILVMNDYQRQSSSLDRFVIKENIIGSSP